MPSHRRSDLAARLQALCIRECTYYTCPDYINPEWQVSLVSPQNDTYASNEVQSTSSSDINEMWRMKICEWCYLVVDHFDFDREVVSVAMSYVDRYSSIHTVNRRIFQLAAMTALYLAIKLYESSVSIHPSSLIHLSRGYFFDHHIIAMEESMLQTLGWHVHPPTPYSFVREMMYFLPGQMSHQDRYDTNDIARFLTELSVCDYWFVSKKPSNIALASLINALELQGEPKIPRNCKNLLLQNLGSCGLKTIWYDDEVIACYERLRDIYAAGEYNPLQSNDETRHARSRRVSPAGPIEQINEEDSAAAAADSNK